MTQHWLRKEIDLVPYLVEHSLSLETEFIENYIDESLFFAFVTSFFSSKIAKKRNKTCVYMRWNKTKRWCYKLFWPVSSYPEPSGFPFFMELLQYSCIRSLNISSTLPNGRQHRLTVQIKNLGLSHDCPRSQNHSLIVTIYCLMVQRYRISKKIPNFLTTFFPIS